LKRKRSYDDERERGRGKGAQREKGQSIVRRNVSHRMMIAKIVIARNLTIGKVGGEAALLTLTQEEGERREVTMSRRRLWF
jgi:hypothetical protein